MVWTALVLLICHTVLISQRAATWRRQRGWLIVYRWYFFFSFLSRNWSQPLVIRAQIFFTDTRVMTSFCQRRSRISNIFFNYFTGCQKPLKMNFFTCFSLGDFTFSITAQKRFGLLESENGFIIYDELPFIRYMITVVQVVLQITALKY